MSATTTAAPERLEFKTELKQLLDLIIHSLYTKKEIFLRELISNAADAIDKARFESLTNPTLIEGNGDFAIRILPNEQAGTLTISDNGIGMSRAGIVENLGTIARSGTKQFLENLKAANVQQRPELIGQFGVGFYASFMAADRVTVLSRTAGPTSEGVRWESDGQGQFTVEPFEKETRGTDVILHVRDDAKEFLSDWRIREIVKRYSDFIDHPITLHTEEEKDGKKEPKEETLNSRQAIWLRPKSEVKPEEYSAFYKQHTRDFEDPLKTIHLAAEGTTEFRALMFLPAHRGMDWMAGPEKKSGLDLYVRRVLITHECEELSPPWMRFVKGVVDSADLPLNVSRETLQHNPVLTKIKSNLVNRILKTLDEMKTGEYETYLKFYKECGTYLKEGAATDFSNRERLADLLLFESTKTDPGKFTTLADYVGRMASEQKEIFYLIGESRELIGNSPYLEAFKDDGREVLLLTDPIDEYLVSSLHSYKEKWLKAADRGDVAKEDSEQKKAKTEQFKSLLDVLKGKIDEVKEVRLSSRLKESAAVLVADEGAMGAHMERLMQRMGREDMPASKRILELNPDHPAVIGLRQLSEKNPADPRVENFARLLFDQAVIAEGSRVKDPAAMARRINDLIAKEAAI
ncbi:MAG: heat shock protein Hsp90 [Phycisphaerales bacterium]|nr:heat shock protein Hsp90 [Phycisphaerales bacterium]